jgi:8-oxo-dGTP pyrophosphatase MutT (NUDIX family)
VTDAPHAAAPHGEALHAAAPHGETPHAAALPSEAPHAAAPHGQAPHTAAPHGETPLAAALPSDGTHTAAAQAEVLHADAVRVLNEWAATSDEAALCRKRTVELLAAGPTAVTRAHRPGHVTASALVVDDAGRVLLCLHGRLGRWMQLGGHCEPGDGTLAAAALREATEESGIPGLWIDPDPIDVDVHDVRCTAGDGTPAGPSVHYDVRFLVHAPAGSTERISDESAALGWFRPGELPEPLASGTARQIPPALARRAHITRP